MLSPLPVRVALLGTVAIICLVARRQPARSLVLADQPPPEPEPASAPVAASEQDQQQQQNKHESELLVHRKYWKRSTEFGEPDNWPDGGRPCTLNNRLIVDEEAVFSLGDSLDAFEGSLDSALIKELTLATNGMLLLDKHSLSDPLDPIIIAYYNESGQCVHDSGREFVFRPPRDQMSWFNPDNWEFTFFADTSAQMVPETLAVPCSEEIAVFGHANSAVWHDDRERDETPAFKVNFRPSEAWLAGFDATTAQQKIDQFAIGGIRVAGLVIDDQSYEQPAFEHLVDSSDFAGILFELNANQSLLRDNERGQLGGRLLSIDKSSVQAETDVCLDPAGCVCGNQETNVREAICSFHEPLKQSEQPCLDPQESSLYCNQVCGTVMTIHMDSKRFSEAYLDLVFNALMKPANEEEAVAGSGNPVKGDVNGYKESVIVFGRRTREDSYEIFFRPVHQGQATEARLGKPLELAELFHQALERNSATKSFYGLRSISVRSSVHWRTGDRMQKFWPSLAIAFVAALMALILQDSCERKLEIARENATPLITQTSLLDSLVLLNQQARDTCRSADSISGPPGQPSAHGSTQIELERKTSELITQ